MRDDRATPEDIAVLENWRAAHAYIINTFQANLRNRARDEEFVVGQRLKRRPTIIDKLQREPDMQLSTMHDIAGCRVIFPDSPDLNEFRHGMHQSRARHKLLYDDPDKFNYIRAPNPPATEESTTSTGMMRLPPAAFHGTDLESKFSIER